jgi:hypothetical protein
MFFVCLFYCRFPSFLQGKLMHQFILKLNKTIEASPLGLGTRASLFLRESKAVLRLATGCTLSSSDRKLLNSTQPVLTVADATAKVECQKCQTIQKGITKGLSHMVHGCHGCTKRKAPAIDDLKQDLVGTIELALVASNAFRRRLDGGESVGALLAARATAGAGAPTTPPPTAARATATNGAPTTPPPTAGRATATTGASTTPPLATATNGAPTTPPPTAARATATNGAPTAARTRATATNGAPTFSMFEQGLMQNDVPLHGDALVQKAVAVATLVARRKYGGRNMDPTVGPSIPSSWAEAVVAATDFNQLQLVNRVPVPVPSKGRPSVFGHLVGGRRIVALNLLSSEISTMLSDVGFPGAPCSRPNCPGYGLSVVGWSNTKGAFRYVFSVSEQCGLLVCAVSNCSECHRNFRHDAQSTLRKCPAEVKLFVGKVFDVTAIVDNINVVLDKSVTSILPMCVRSAVGMASVAELLNGVEVGQRKQVSFNLFHRTAVWWQHLADDVADKH